MHLCRPQPFLTDGSRPNRHKEEAETTDIPAYPRYYISMAASLVSTSTSDCVSTTAAETCADL